MLYTGTDSFQEASDACKSRTVARMLADKRYDTVFDQDSAEAEFDSVATRALFPMHSLNLMSCVVALSCVVIWLELNPHQDAQAAALDTKLGSFFMVQLIAQILSALLGLRGCIVDQSTYEIVRNAYYLVLYGVSIIATNILCHRYLDEKAKTMARIMGADPDEGESWLSPQVLAVAYKWEVRTLWLAPIGVVAYTVYRPAGALIASVSAVGILSLDSVITVITTVIFLRPVLFALAHVSDDRRHTTGFKSMQQTKFMTLVGSSVATLSSTVLYINVILMLVISGKFSENALLNPLVFMANVDCILNCIGMLLVSGVPKAVLRNLGSSRRGALAVTPLPNQQIMPSSS
jgi:hypothetical protein